MVKARHVFRQSARDLLTGAIAQAKVRQSQLPIAQGRQHGSALAVIEPAGQLQFSCVFQDCTSANIVNWTLCSAPVQLSVGRIGQE
jgi:hypothetical protein